MWLQPVSYSNRYGTTGIPEYAICFHRKVVHTKPVLTFSSSLFLKAASYTAAAVNMHVHQTFTAPTAAHHIIRTQSPQHCYQLHAIALVIPTQGASDPH